MKLGAQVTVSNLPDVNDFDRWAFQPEPFDDGASVLSFGGVSGGGLWRVWLRRAGNNETTLVQRRFLGVAYYQIAPTDDAPRKIVAHGSKSIFDHLVPEIRRQGFR